MRLFEFAAPILFLCTSTPEKEGEVASLNKPIQWLKPELEAAIEAQRPEGALPRSRSLILATSPGGAEFTYAVEPIGKLERQNLGWLLKLQEADPSQPGVLAHYAIGYWSGRECPEASGAAWEYRASEVKISKRIGRSGQEI